MKFVAVALAFIGVAASYTIDNIQVKPVAVAQPGLGYPQQQQIGIAVPLQPVRPLNHGTIITPQSNYENQAVNAAYNAGYHQAVANNQGAQVAALAQQQQHQQQQLFNAGVVPARPAVVGSVHGNY